MPEDIKFIEETAEEWDARQLELKKQFLLLDVQYLIDKLDELFPTDPEFEERLEKFRLWKEEYARR